MASAGVAGSLIVVPRFSARFERLTAVVVFSRTAPPISTAVTCPSPSSSISSMRRSDSAKTLFTTSDPVPTIMRNTSSAPMSLTLRVDFLSSMDASGHNSAV
eukprot:3911371-Prymnesium_polylepis.1